MPEKIASCLNRGRMESLGNDDVSIVCKMDNPERTTKVDFVTFIVQSHFDTLLCYVLSVTFCWVAVLKVMDQKTLVKRSMKL